MNKRFNEKLRLLVQEMIEAVKKQLDLLVKVVFFLSIVCLITQGVIRLVLDIDWFDLKVNQYIASFFLFKIPIAQVIIMQLALMLNYVLAIGIANKSPIKDIIKKIWWLLLATYCVNFLPKEYSFFITVIIGIIINVLYLVFGKEKGLRVYITSTLKICLVSIGLLAYQYLTILIRLNHIPVPGEVFGFYEQFVYMIDMYLLMYLLYKYFRQRTVK